MTCQDLNADFVDYVNDQLNETRAEEVRLHLAECEACAAEIESLRAVWSALGRIGEEEPSPALEGRFYAMLDAYKEGLAARRAPWSERAAAWLAGWWPQRPVVQLAMTAAALVIGLGIGMRLAPPSGNEIVQLRGEVESLNHLVSLSLLSQDSASSRLQGLAYSRRGQADDEMLAALVDTLNNDDNVNVRLAAVDALARFAARRPVADELRESLLTQSSPLVQLALVDLLFEVNGPETREIVHRLYERDDLDQTVRGHIAKYLGPQA